MNIEDFRPSRAEKSAAQSGKKTEQTTEFLTPEQASERDAVEVKKSTPLDMELPEAPAKKHKIPGHHWFNLPWPPNREEIILICAVLVLAIGGGVAFAVLHKPAHKPVVATVKPTPKPAPKPAPILSDLTGLPIPSADVNKRPVVATMIENSLDARPQSGLSQAGVVYEAVAEGGITRYLAVYQDQQPDNIGPIRSARPYYVQWAEGYRAAYAHVGGSPDALSDIKDWGVQDLNQFYNAGLYWRSTSRPAPHNVYANVATLAQGATGKGFTSNYTPWPRKTAAPSKTPTAGTIALSMSGPLYDPSYVYDVASNTYKRSENGGPQIDANTNAQLAPTVVIAMVVPLGQGALDASGAYYSNYNPIGTGQAYIFQDGGVTQATWSKAGNTTSLSFTDANDKPVKLNPGQTWVTAVSDASKVSYH